MGSNLPYVQSYKSLTSYKHAIDLANQIFHVSMKFPKEETYSLTDQLRRSSRSIGAQIAESWGKRRYIKHFISKLTDAYAEAYETEHGAYIAYQCKYIKNKEYQTLARKCNEICHLVGGMITKANKFCACNFIQEYDHRISLHFTLYRVTGEEHDRPALAIKD